MITVTRLDGATVLLNHELIETIEQTPDTVVVLVNGHRLVVRDSPGDLVARAIAFERAAGYRLPRRWTEDTMDMDRAASRHR